MLFYEEYGTHTALCCKSIGVADLLVIGTNIGLARWAGQWDASAKRVHTRDDQGQLSGAGVVA
jgi:hypothetical protein